MKYCQKCGKEILDEAVICIHCGCAVPGTKIVDSNDSPDMLLAVISACFCIIGLILFLVYRDSKPQKASSCIKGTIVGLCIYIMAAVLVMPYFY